MSANSASYLVAYDVTDDDERNRVSRVLKGFGFRVQKSVFECRLSRGMRGQLVGKLKALELKSGFVSLYRLTARSRRIDVGQPPERPHREDEEHAFLF